MKTTKVQIFGRSFERSRTLAACCFAGALFFMVLGVAIGDAVGTILAAVGSTLGTTALVSFLYDPFLKDLLAQEIFERVGIRDAVVRAGLEDVGALTQVGLDTRLAGTREIRALPLNPLSWAREIWPDILRVAENGRVEVQVVLPSPDECQARQVLARRLDLGENELSRQLAKLPSELVKDWDRASTHSEATLSVLTHEAAISTGLLICDSCSVIETAPAMFESTTQDIGLVERFSPESPYTGWVKRQLDEILENAATADLRPVTPAAELPGRRAAKSPGGTDDAAAVAAPPSSPATEAEDSEGEGESGSSGAISTAPTSSQDRGQTADRDEPTESD